jgi:DnaJ-class molecular chaperone
MIMEKRCPYCKGHGMLPDPGEVISKRKACPVCMGRGFNLVPKDANRCSFCQGTGQVATEHGNSKLCPDCRGIGSIW